MPPMNDATMASQWPNTDKVSRERLIPIHNDSLEAMSVAGRTIPAGETRHFEESLVPLHLRPKVAASPAPDPEPWDPEKIIRTISSGTVKSIGEQLPNLSSAELTALGRLEEASDKPRSGVLAAIQEQQLKRASAATEKDRPQDENRREG